MVRGLKIVLLFVTEIKAEGNLLYRTFYFMNFEVRKGSLFNLLRTTIRSGNSILSKNTNSQTVVGINIKCNCVKRLLYNTLI